MTPPSQQRAGRYDVSRSDLRYVDIATLGVHIEGVVADPIVVDGLGETERVVSVETLADRVRIWISTDYEEGV